MTPATLLHQLIQHQAALRPDAPALLLPASQHYQQREQLNYRELAGECAQFAAAAAALGIQRGERIAIYLDKRWETVVSCFGASQAGAVFVPINPLLKPEQVAYILRDCNVRLLVTAPERYSLLTPVLAELPDLAHVLLTGDKLPASDTPLPYQCHPWALTEQAPPITLPTPINRDMVAILYTSGSTGRPKGVVLSHQNMVTGAYSVAEYLGNHPQDVLLAALPLSFDAGFSQLTTAFASGASVALLNYLFPKDVLKAVVQHRVTGLTAVPPLWMQLAGLAWPESVRDHLRYFANTGGRMPLATLTQLREHFPQAQPFLMYGLTEAFRATYLPPSEVDRRPDSIGKAIPNCEVLVLREDGSVCDDDEPGELVQRGALVALGYWGDAEKTAERFKPLPPAARQFHQKTGFSGTQPACNPYAGLMLPEIAVFSGDTVRRDAEGFLYFIGRRDEMIKTSGYRVSPNEVEEVFHATGLLREVAAVGEEHPTLGQAIVLHVYGLNGTAASEADWQRTVLHQVKSHLPAYMLPVRIELHEHPLPRNPNGKIDRKQLATSH